MRIAPSPTLGVSVGIHQISAPVVGRGERWAVQWGPQINNFEQVSSLGYQMSLAREGASRVMGNGHMGPPCGRTDTHDWKHYIPATSLTGGKKSLSHHAAFQKSLCKCFSSWIRTAKLSFCEQSYIMFIFGIIDIASTTGYYNCQISYVP